MKNEFEKYATQHVGINSMTLHDYKSKMGTGFGPVGMTPYIIEERQMNITQMDVFSRLMQERILFLGTGIDDQVANIVNAQLLFLESVDSNKDITIILNSPGGSVISGLAIYDTMNFIKPAVSTQVVGLAASMGFVLATAGAKGKRYALKHSRLMQHQPMGGVAPGTQASDIEITAREIQKFKKELYDIISFHTGQPYEKIEADADRDCWMTSQEAKDYGVIDKVIVGRNK
jgi:ATP-dependent Clp protease protease subunit